MQFQLQESERLPPEAIRQAQFRQLKNLIRHAIGTVPHYRNALGAAGIDPASIEAPGEWRKIPLLSRREIQLGGQALLSTAAPAPHGSIVTLSTSGSTGAPVTIRTTELSQFFWHALTLRNYLWHRFDFSGKLVAIRSAAEGESRYPQGTQLPGWDHAASAVFHTGPAALLHINTDIDQQLEWLAREKPDYLVTYPTNLAALLVRCRQTNQKIAGLRAVMTLSEILSPETRALCREAWGREIVDMYTTQEVGYLALQCPEGEHYHVQSENALVEVIDDQGAPCGPDETGRVVVTALHNFAMPLIRYDLGDFATVGGVCACGRGLPVLARVLGRVRNMMTLPSRQQVWPHFGGAQLAALAPIRQYQLVQRSLTALELRVVADRPLSDDEQAKIRAHINGNVGADFAIGFVYLDAIPRSAGGKFEDFRSEIAL